MRLSICLGSGHKLVVLHYNPDSFRIDGKNVTVATKERQKKLVETLQAWLVEDPAKEKQLARFFLFYDCTSNSTLPVVAKEWESDEARAVSAILPI